MSAALQRRGAALPGQDTLVASWAALARLSPGAQLLRTPVGPAAVFPAWAPLNNAILAEVGAAAARAAAVERLKSVYHGAGADVWALWVPSMRTDFAAPDTVADVGDLARDVTTLVMRTELSPWLRGRPDVRRTSIEAATRAGGDEPIPVAELPEPDGVAGLTGWVMVDADGLAVAGAWSYLHDSDCGIYAVGTLPDRRRRGFARALMEHVLASAHRRGARTATLQSTPMGEPLYTALGFTAVGRYEEWISKGPRTNPTRSSVTDRQTCA